MDQMHILLVDDEERFISTTKLLLEKRGVRAATAINGPDALAILAQRPIDVVILDVKMPGMDGISVLQHIKRQYPLIEVIMLTGHASVESAVEGLKQGAFDYLMKPADISELLTKALHAFERKRAMEEKISKPNGGHDAPHPMSVFEKEKFE